VTCARAKRTDAKQATRSPRTTLSNVLSGLEFQTIAAIFNFLIFLAASEDAHPRLRHGESSAMNQ
jgi:hypothetical protein